MDTIPGLDLSEAIEALARQLCAGDSNTWDDPIPHLWHSTEVMQMTYRDVARRYLDVLAPIVERQVLARAARSLEWLDLTGATVLVLEDGRRVLFAFHQHLNTETAIERVRRLQDSLPRHVAVVVVDGVEHIGVEPTKEVAGAGHQGD